MSSWTALNIEPAEAVEEEVDDTKEIQIEEALKLYQNALKLHSQGPQFYNEAAEAYDALLNSEIFKYPESISDYKRTALQDSESQLAEPIDYTISPAAVEPLVEFDTNDSTSSTLLQTIYLSYKNHGQYILDALRALLQNPPKETDGQVDLSSETAKRASAALASFADALERDDTDLNLWRQSARLSSALKSYRLARYCLESVLADDENRLEVRTEQLGLEETFAEEHLRDTLRSLGDRIAVSQVPLKKPKKALLKFLKRQSDPYPYLPALPKELEESDPSRNPLAFGTSRHEIQPSAPTWAATGKEILKLLSDNDADVDWPGPGCSIAISLPSVSPEVKAIVTEDAELANPPLNADEENAAPVEKQDIQMPGVDDTPAEAQQPSVKTEAQNEPSGPASEHIDDHSSIDQGAEKQLMDSLEVQSSNLPEATGQQEATNAEEPDLKSGVGGRKRSSASAMPDDQTEPTRAKSRRTRLRESNVDSTLQTDEVAFDQTKYYEDRLEEYVQADEWMFTTAGSLLSKIGVELGTIDELRKLVPCTNDKDPESPIDRKAEYLLPRDLRDTIKNWDEAKSQAMLQGDNFSNLQDIKGIGNSGLAIFLEHSRKSARKLGMNPTLSGVDELVTFVNIVNEKWLYAQEVAFEWLRGLLTPNFGDNSLTKTDAVLDRSKLSDMASTYVLYQWPDALKETVVQVALADDEYIYKRLCEQLECLERQLLCRDQESPFEYTLQDFADLEMSQTLFELHLDIYASMNNPNSEVDQETRALQRDRVARWCMLARTALTHYMDHTAAGADLENITIRHIWASTFYSNMTSDAQPEHVLLSLHELKRLLHGLKDPVINLVNNAIMQEISTGAVDQEISKLKSMDFFMRIFNPDSEDPVSLIETIEPILEPSSVQFDGDQTADDSEIAQSTSQIREMGSFLDSGDATLRLFLWKRLQDAYAKIDYPPKVVSCYLRSIEIILKEISSPAHLEEPSEHRQITLLRWLKSLDGVLAKTVTTVLNDPRKAYECFDMDHLKASMSAVAQLTRLLHSFVMYEDSIRVGQISGPELRGSLAKSAEKFRDRLREMHVRCWILQYTLLKEAVSQNREIFDTPLDNCIHYLRSVHNALGIREMCRRSQKQFLKLMKSELTASDLTEDIELDVCQILFDLHGIKLSPVDGLVMDHGCPPEKLDRATATMMIDFVLRQAKKLNIKDLSKSELKSTIDKMQQAIGITKSSPPYSYNKRIVNAYLKSPINPTELFRAIRGVEDLPLIPVPTESAEIAQKGWYFLLGHAALTKFRSQKRLNPVPTTDLDEAISWFRQDIDHGTTRWESWYRLAQTYDTKLEEDITWSADKINSNKTDLVTWQRNAIHCYAMAISTAIRYGEPTQDTRMMLADLFTDFGIRLYSSSREPLSMAAFSLADFTRHYNSEENKQMYEAQPFKEMRLYSVWSLASFLLRHATVDKPKNWMTHYMRSKCLWKMFSCDESVRGGAKAVHLDDLLDCLLDAIDALPQKKDSRSDPIFEPHFKLVSIVHKLVTRGALTPADASKTLMATPWARKVQPPEDNSGWKSYILAVLRNLKNADKSNWHHRMAVRSAHVIYDDSKDAAAASGAKNELTHQIFTKTMTIQVWRPEYERPGRHFVYTTRYVYFFVALLEQLDDRANLEQLLRRVRKKQGDFINHTKLWEDVCLTYARVIRRAGHINEGHEEGVFRPIGWEEFVANTARLEGLSQLAPESQALLELLRDAVELKKLNNNLMKVSLLEDLIADLYSRLYEVNMPQVLEQANEENKEKMKVDHLLMASDGAGETPTPPTSAPASEAPAPRGRTKGIARRDIQKRAETIVNRKLGPRAPAAKAPAPVETEPTQGPEVSVSVSVTSAPRPTKEAPPRTDGAAEEAGSGQHSDVPNSVHDSADDESELSEMDDEKLSKLASERKTLFSNLQNRGGSMEPDSEMSGQADGDGANEMAVEVHEDVDNEGDTALGDVEGEDGDEVGDGDDVEMEGEDGDEENEAGGEEGVEEQGEQEGEEEGDGEENDGGDTEGVQEGDDDEPEQAEPTALEKDDRGSSDVDRMDIK